MSAAVNGHIAAVSRTDGKLLWSVKADSSRLILDHMRQSPLLLLTSRKVETVNGRSRSVSSMMAVDKKTGEIAAQTKGSTSDTYQSLRISKAGRFMELRAYNHRLRVTAKAPPK